MVSVAIGEVQRVPVMSATLAGRRACLVDPESRMRDCGPTLIGLITTAVDTYDKKKQQLRQEGKFL